jgi:serine/threonine protein kinase
MASRNRLVRLSPALLLAVTQIIIIQLGTTVPVVEAQNTNFNFPFFGAQDQDSFLMVDDVQYFAENSSFLLNERAAALSIESCARLLYSDPVRMKDSSSGAVASFQTAFTFQITSQNTMHGDGMSFTFVSNSSFTGQTGGGDLCLVQSANNGQASNQVFAVEFDTYYNREYNDSSDSHIGVDINSVNSSWSYNLCTGNAWNCSYLTNGGYFTAWIDYDNASQSLQVFFANGSLYNNTPKPRQAIITAAVPLTGLVGDYMYVGFTSSTGRSFEVHQIQSWTFTSTGIPTGANRSRKVGIIVGVSVGVVAALLALACFIIPRCWSLRSRKKKDKFSLVDQNLVPRMFTYRELTKATKSFSKSELLGSGAFGSVYKGTLPSGALVAVKRMRHESTHGEESFLAEAASLSQIRHRNLVQLRGWCHEEEQLFLVYDYMCNGSLDEWLYHFSKRRGKVKGASLNRDVEALPLGLRYSVLSGVAAALSYLHEECMQCVLHRDIKSSNVLLDGDLNAYLGDFGLARLIDHQKMEKTTMMAGTLGYMAPEMPHTGKATRESDVYSFGVLVLEVMCGMRPLDVTAIERGDGILVDMVWRAHEAGNVLQVADSRLGATFPRSHSALGLEFESEGAESVPMHGPDDAMEETKLITNLLHLGLLCCNPNPEDRPSTRLVSQLLQSSENLEMSMPSLPACKPRADYSTPGFSQFVKAALSSSEALSSSHSIRVREAQLSESTVGLPSGVSNGEAGNNLQSSFVASSAIFSGR